MADVKDKIRALFETPMVGVLATITDEGKPRARYVVARMDEEMTLRIATNLGSNKVGQIKAKPEVHFVTGFTSMETTKGIVQVDGKAEITTVQTERDAIWNDQLSTYFKGPSDPNLAVVIIRPTRIEYATMSPEPMEVWEP